MIFKNWLDTRPKMETHDPNAYPTILGGVSRGFWTPFLDWGARSAVFLARENGTFCGSPHLYAPLVKRNMQNLKRSFFRDNLMHCIAIIAQVHTFNNLIMLNIKQPIKCKTIKNYKGYIL